MSNVAIKSFYRNAIVISKNFSLGEFECSCCGRVMIDKRLIDVLQKIRERVGKPLIVNSGYRCEAHNAEVGGVPNSHHCQGLAGDIACREEFDLNELVKIAEDCDAKRIGIYKKRNFLHISVEDAYHRGIMVSRRFYK